MKFHDVSSSSRTESLIKNLNPRTEAVVLRARTSKHWTTLIVAVVEITDTISIIVSNLTIHQTFLFVSCSIILSKEHSFHLLFVSWNC